MTKTFKPDDIVCHKAAFLRSVQWYTGVPINGKVQDVKGDLVLVLWSNEDQPTYIRDSNIILFSERHLEPR